MIGGGKDSFEAGPVYRYVLAKCFGNASSFLSQVFITSAEEISADRSAFGDVTSASKTSIVMRHCQRDIQFGDICISTARLS
jgi:hypothetical protein